MTLYPVTAVLMATVCFSSLAVMALWHILSKGYWRRWAAGVSLMALLATTSAITALAATSGFFPGFPGRRPTYIVLYIIFILSIWAIGYAIIRAQRDRN